MATVEFPYVPREFLSIHPLEKPVKAAIFKKESIFDYKAFAGRPGSSDTNFVLVDWLVSWLADIFRVSEDDLKAK